MNDWLLWQLADSSFPMGGFAHSGGLEAASQHGELRGRDDLLMFLHAAIQQSGCGTLPFVGAVFGEKSFRDVDGLCDAFTSNHVANRSSRLQGQAFVHSAERAFSIPEISGLRDEVRATAGHFAPVFGEVTRLLGLERVAALRLFLFTQIRSWLSSAVRLGTVGTFEAQAMQARLSSYAEQTVERCAHVRVDDVTQTAPLIDLYQGTHDRLYSRLFQS